MRETKLVPVPQATREIVAGVRCNRCHEDIVLDRGSFGSVLGIRGGHLQISFGYGSEFDDESWHGDFCDDCAKTVMKELGLERA